MAFKAVGYSHSHGSDKKFEERLSIRSILRSLMKLKKKTLLHLILHKKTKIQKMNETQYIIYLEKITINIL